MALMPTSPEWTRQPYPPALPFGVIHKCLTHCVDTPDFELRYLPSPCVCSTEGQGGIDPDAPRINSPLTANAQVGVAFSYQITATNPPHTSFTATGLPAGLTMNATGLITGTPAPGTQGLRNVQISATNAAGTGPVATLRINVATAPVFTPISYVGYLLQSSGGAASGVQTISDPNVIPGLAGVSDMVGRANPTAGSTIVVPIPAVVTPSIFGVIIAYPATLPAATQIINNPSGLNEMGSFNRAPNPWMIPQPSGPDVSYRVYALHNNAPFSIAGNTGYTLHVGT